MIRQGDVFWVEFSGSGSEPSGRRPAVVVQSDRFNASAIRTVIVLPVTSTLRLGGMPGNVSLRKGEASLPKPSVINVSQPVAIDRGRLVARLGSISRSRLRQVLAGICLVIGVDVVVQGT